MGAILKNLDNLWFIYMIMAFLSLVNSKNYALPPNILDV
ncbi:hypothetical protein Pedsa_3292 [Pseudopedobacter saltans DSM 12145]|uniref:Uncharacterized protein n=1 Tax=Pseudopedobacter saltans (strain ATCC 51119 / DSM 12145 / JCM 21818 / CCUG 39354 / LMG 10337 / NBRC 100064 / NCIMB 13643) TaxID=762903 RepID=F0SBY6_PSESL|nr:hypothetical protein Pedsa_3292 [Pseudopedobacter saltans DSM 12145]